MKLLILDIETTGLNPRTHQIVQVAGILYDTSKPEQHLLAQLPYFCIVVANEKYTFDDLDGWVLDNCMNIMRNTSKHDVVLDCELDEFLCSWLINNFSIMERVTVAGKNFAGFDRQFLQIHAPGFCKRMKHRVLDVGTLFVDLSKDIEIPSMPDIAAHLNLHQPKHDALDDCTLMLEAIYSKLTQKATR